MCTKGRPGVDALPAALRRACRGALLVEEMAVLESLKYEAVPHCSMRMGMGGVYLMGALEFLSAPGEFAIAGGYVYYRPLDASTPIEQLTIVASIPERAVQFVAPSSAAPVSDITLQVGHTRTHTTRATTTSLPTPSH